MKASVANVAVLLVAFFAGATLYAKAGPAELVTRTDTVAPAQFALIAQRHRLRTEGLRARLEGIETRAPAVIVRTDTLVTPPDTVFEFVSVRDGRVTSSVLIAVDSTALRAPELHEGADVSNCDEGFEVSAAGVVCDPAQLGHLYVGPWLSRSPMLAVWWKPSYRSPWEVFAGWQGGDQWDAGVRRGVKVW